MDVTDESPFSFDNRKNKRQTQTFIKGVTEYCSSNLQADGGRSGQ